MIVPYEDVGISVRLLFDRGEFTYDQINDVLEILAKEFNERAGQFVGDSRTLVRVFYKETELPF